MTNLIVFLKCLRLLENHIVKIFLIVALLSSISLSQPDSVKVSKDTVQQKFVMQKSPVGALLRSALLPGWGQIYNHSYWKAPIIWGFIGYYLYYWIRNNNKYLSYSDSTRKYLAENNERYYKPYQSVRDQYHDQRDLFTIYIAITYFLNLLDAYVDAHLFDFDIREEPFGKTARLNFRLNF